MFFLSCLSCVINNISIKFCLYLSCLIIVRSFAAGVGVGVADAASDLSASLVSSEVGALDRLILQCLDGHVYCVESAALLDISTARQAFINSLQKTARFDPKMPASYINPAVDAAAAALQTSFHDSSPASSSVIGRKNMLAFNALIQLAKPSSSCNSNCSLRDSWAVILGSLTHFLRMFDLKFSAVPPRSRASSAGTTPTETPANSFFANPVQVREQTSMDDCDSGSDSAARSFPIVANLPIKRTNKSIATAFAQDTANDVPF